MWKEANDEMFRRWRSGFEEWRWGSQIKKKRYLRSPLKVLTGEGESKKWILINSSEKTNALKRKKSLQTKRFLKSGIKMLPNLISLLSIVQWKPASLISISLKSLHKNSSQQSRDLEKKNSPKKFIPIRDFRLINNFFSENFYLVNYVELFRIL